MQVSSASTELDRVSSMGFSLAVLIFLGFFFVLLHWFGCVDFSEFLFCSSSLVLMGTVGLWLCSDFYGFDGGCGGVWVVE